MTERYRAIIIKDGKLALMERRKNGRHYWVYPGGGLEGNETKEENPFTRLADGRRK